MPVAAWSYHLTIFIFLQSLIQRTQDKLVFWYDFDCQCHFTFLPPYSFMDNLLWVLKTICKKIIFYERKQFIGKSVYFF